jgi:hypothetical protein
MTDQTKSVMDAFGRLSEIEQTEVYHEIDKVMRERARQESRAFRMFRTDGGTDPCWDT